MKLIDYVIKENDEYEQIVNKYGFNSKEESFFIRKFLLSIGDCEYTEEEFYDVLSRCLNADNFIGSVIKGYRAGYTQKDVIKTELQNRYLLEIDESKEKPIIIESYKAWFNIRTHELTARKHTEPKWEWGQIWDYRGFKGVDWYDLVDKYAEKYDGKIIVHTKNGKKEYYIRCLMGLW